MTNNPFADLFTDATTIRTAGGQANTMIMNSQTFYTLASNSWLRTGSGTSVVSQGPAFTPTMTAGPLTLPGLPGYQIFIEETIAKGDIFVLDKRAAVFLDGPRSTRIVEDNMHNVVDTISDYWFGTGLRVSTWILPANGYSNLDMTTAVQGLTLSKEDALKTLTDFKGNAIEFTEKDGNITSKPVEGDNYTYTYSLTPQTTIVTVNVAKNPKKTQARAASPKEEKEAEKYNADKDKYQKKSY